MIHAYPNKWTPKRAHRFCMTRIDKIRFLLEEIAGCYEDVEQGVVNEADELYRYGLTGLIEMLDYALEDGKTP